MITKNTSTYSISRITLACFIALGQIIAPVYGQIVADPNAGAHRPTVVTPPNSNNVPVVNITRPNAAGVSRNEYQQFDVQNQGAILNNNATNSNTQLGGWIQGNPNLAPGQNARIILNEVTSGNPSMLSGYIEVAGGRAEVIIANPAGIAVQGGGFINASSATLTTGKPIFNATGHLEAFRVGGNNARIAINGKFDTSTVDYTRIIARAVEVNSGIWANDLTIAAGTGDFAPNGSPIQLTVEDEAGRPLFAIDVAQLGGMYAGKIHLIGTEEGVGVRNAGHIGASVGQVAITADGKLINTGVVNAQTHIQLQAREIDNQATIYSQGTLTAHASNIVNSNILAAQNNANITAQSLYNAQNALIAGGLNKEGELKSVGDLNVTLTNTLTNQGTLAGSSKLTIGGQAAIDNQASGQILAGQTLALNVDALTNRGLMDGTTTHLQANTITNIGTGRIYGDHVAIEGVTLTNTDEAGKSAVIAAREHMSIGIDELYNKNGGLIYSLGHLVIGGELDATTLNAQGSATLVQNDGGSIEAVKDLVITAAEIQNLNTAFESETVAQGFQNVFDHVVNGTPIHNKDNVLYFKEDGSSDYTVGGWKVLNTLNEAKNWLGDSSNWFMLKPSTLYTQDQTLAIFRLGGLRSLPNDARGEYSAGGRYYSAWSILGVEAPKAGDSIEVVNQKFNALNSQVWRFRNDIENRKVSRETMRQYVETHYRTEVTQSRPGELIAGGNIILHGDVTNDKSRIIAGQTLSVTGNINHIAAVGQDYYERHGIQVNTSRTASGRGWGDEAAFNQTTQATAVDLGVTEVTEGATVTDRDVSMDSGTLTPPTSSIYTVNPGSDKNYLIETDPRLTGYGNWLSSDYMLGELGLAGDLTYKRLGDGFYEQKLIREQIGKLTGYRFLAGYNSDDEQYKALMNAGAQYAQEHKLQVGIALTAEQMKQLTTDIVWMVSQDVTLPDGSVESVLVPQVYTASGAGLISPEGGLMSANNVQLMGQGNTLNNSGTIAARDDLIINMGDIKNSATGHLHGNNTLLQATNNIENIGGIISADNSIQMVAGGDIIHSSTVTQGYDQHGTLSGIGNTGLIYLSGEGSGEGSGENSGNIHIQAGGDIKLQGAAIVNNSGANKPTNTSAEASATQESTESTATTTTAGSTTLIAGGDIHIGTLTTQNSHNVRFDNKNHLGMNSTDEHGSQILTTGDINLTAGNNLTIRGSELESTDGALTAQANTIRIEAAEQHTNNSANFYNENSRLGGSKKQEWRNQTIRTDLVGSSLSADTIHLQSVGDMTIQASDVVATNDVNLISTGGNISIESGTGRDFSSSFHSKKKTGISSTGFGVHIGSTKETTEQSSRGTYAQAAVVGSLEGNVNIQAGQGTYTQTGSDVMALQGDINVTAQDIAITESRETRRDEHRYEYKQSGLSVSINSPVISAIQTAQQMSEASKRTGSSRSQALAAGATALSAVNNGVAMHGALKNIGNGPLDSGAMGISVSLGSSKSTNTSTTVSDTAKGSNLTAGGSINLTATGEGGEQPNANSGNILIQGSNISANKDISLSAQNDVNILAASNTEDRSSSNKSSSGSIGMSVGAGGFGVSISGSKGKGSSNGHDQYWTGSTITAGNQLTINSGNNTNIIGSQVTGENVVANVGGDLNIVSVQDTSKERSSQSNKSGSLGFTWGPAGGLNGSYNNSNVKGDGTHNSVGDYAGIMAGDGGFNITVGGNTHLGGSVIASTENAVTDNKNSLTTGTLTTENIYNRSEYEVKGESSGISGGFSKGDDGKFGGLPNIVSDLPLKGKDSDSQSSITTSGVSGGQITITNEDKQQELTGKTGEETVAELDREVITGQLDANSLDKDWNLQEIVDGMQADLEITKELIAGSTNLVDTLNKLQENEWKALESEIAKGNLTPDQLASYLDQIAQLKDENIWGMGGTGRLIVTAINGALSGNVGGANADILNGAMVNFIQGQGAGIIKDFLNSDSFNGTAAEKEQLRGLLQGILACGGASAQGGDCSSAALGAGGAVLINHLLGTNAKGMSEEQKQERADLVNSIIGGVTEALGGDANAAVIAGKIEQENNRLTTDSERKKIQELAQGNKQAEDHMMIAACALIKCSEQFDVDDPLWYFYKELEMIGSGDEYANLRDLLKEQYELVDNSYTTSSGLVVNAGTQREEMLFEYGLGDSISDHWTWVDGKAQITVRGLGLLQAAGGAATATMGAGVCTSGVGCAGGAFLFVVGSDQMITGLKTAIEGQANKTLGAHTLEALGVDPKYSELVYGAIDIVGTTKAGISIALKNPQTGEVVHVVLSTDRKIAEEIAGESVHVTKVADDLISPPKGGTNTGGNASNALPEVNLPLKPSTPVDEIADQARQKLLDEINSFSSARQASKSAAMIGAYDPKTGLIAVASNNTNITASALHPTTVQFVERELGVKIGELTGLCANKAAACAEVIAADQLVRQGVNPSNIRFTDAVRPGMVYRQGSIHENAIVPRCSNCQTLWPIGE